VWGQAHDPAFRLEIGWVRGHNGTEGNERVDGEAKEAAKGRTSLACNLPCFLATGALPLSTAAARQASNSLMHALWRKEWAGSPWHPRLSQIDPSMPSNGFRKLVSELSRAQTSILIQFRTGHVPLSKHLFRINKASSPACPSCQQDEESVHHFLFDGPTWRHDRWLMGQALGSKAKSADYIFGSQKGVAELLKFVGRMGRLKRIAGDVPPLTS